MAEFISLNGCRIGEAVSIEPCNYESKSRILQLHGTFDHTEGYRNGEKTAPKTLASYRETIMTSRELEILQELEFMNELEKIQIIDIEIWDTFLQQKTVFQFRLTHST